jgi:hypothetical protein
VRRQSRPRRGFWQRKTVRDRLDERRTRARKQIAKAVPVVQDAASVAAERAKTLAEQAAQTRQAAVERAAALRAEARRQSRPRRGFWQRKTVRDRLDERSAQVRQRAAQAVPVAQDAAEVAIERAKTLAEQSRPILQATAAAAGGFATEARRQSRPRRGFWQRKTLRDQFDEQSARARKQASKAVPVVQDAASVAAERARGLAEKAVPAVQATVSAASERVQQLAANSSRAGDLAAATTDAIKETADSVGATLSATAESAAAVAQRPVTAINTGVRRGKRTARHGVRVVRTALWAALIGIAIGLLVAPTTGAELRRQLREVFDRLGA